MIGAMPFEPLDQRRRLAAARKACVEARNVGQRDPKPAKAYGEADRGLLRQRDVRAGAVKPREESRRTDFGQELDRRQIERHLQRLPRSHRALVAEVEVLRRVSAVAHRAVEQHRLGVREALLKRERVDEGLQRRARRARRTRHVDGAVARRILEVGGADASANFAGSIVDDHDRRGQFGAEPGDASPGERFKLRLQTRVDGEADDLRLPVGGDRLFRRVGGKFGEGLAGRRDRLATGRGSPSSALMIPRAATRSSTRFRAARAASLERSGRRASGDCGSATRSAASAIESFSGSLPK